MSTWRNLMTPLYEKFYAHESLSSGFSISRSNHKISSRMIKSPKGDIKIESPCNYRIAELKNEMNKLKTELAKFPKQLGTSSMISSNNDAYHTDIRKQKNNNQGYSSIDPAKQLNFNEVKDNSDNSKDMECSTSQADDFDKNKPKIFQKKFIQKLDSAYEKLQKDDNATHKIAISPKNNDEGLNILSMFRENLIKSSINYANNNTIEEEEISIDHIKEKFSFRDDSDDDNNSLLKDKSCENGINKQSSRSYKRQSSTYSSLRKSHKINERLKERLIGSDESLNESTEIILKSYKEEIDELKAIIIHSKSKIDNLEDELNIEKKKSKNLRQKILKITKKANESAENGRYSSYEERSNSKENILCLKKIPKKLNQKNVKITKDNDNLESNFKSNNSNSIKKRKKYKDIVSTKDKFASLSNHVNMNMYTANKNIKASNIANILANDDDIKENSDRPYKDNRDNKQYQFQHNTKKNNKALNAFMSPRNIDYESAKMKKNIYKDCSIQCDLILEKSNDIENEKQIEFLNDQVKQKDDQIKKIKSEKNAMIKAFQNIVKELSKQNQTQDNGKLSNIHEAFTRFHHELQQRYDNIKMINHKPQIINPNTTNQTIKEALFEDTMPTPIADKFSKSKGLKTDMTENFMYSQSNIEFSSFYENLLESHGVNVNNFNGINNNNKTKDDVTITNFEESEHSKKLMRSKKNDND